MNPVKFLWESSGVGGCFGKWSQCEWLCCGVDLGEWIGDFDTYGWVTCLAMVYWHVLHVVTLVMEIVVGMVWWHIWHVVTPNWHVLELMTLVVEIIVAMVCCHIWYVVHVAVVVIKLIVVGVVMGSPTMLLRCWVLWGNTPDTTLTLGYHTCIGLLVGFTWQCYYHDVTMYTWLQWYGEGYVGDVRWSTLHC
jgi:hypothetical protein